MVTSGVAEIDLTGKLDTDYYGNTVQWTTYPGTVAFRTDIDSGGNTSFYESITSGGTYIGYDNGHGALHEIQILSSTGIEFINNNKVISVPSTKNGTLALTDDIPTATSDLTNDSGFITVNDVPQEVAFAIYGQTTYTEIYAFSTANKYVVVVDNGKLVPCTISLVGSTVVCSHFENGSEIIYVVTSEGWTSTSTSYATTASLATVATSGSYNDLSNTPTVSNVQIVRWSEENN